MTRAASSFRRSATRAGSSGRWPLRMMRIAAVLSVAIGA